MVFAGNIIYFCGMNTNYEVHLAPLQGYTDRIYRNNFARFFGGTDACYTPFIRMEAGGTFRNKDLKEADPALNTAAGLIPQILPGTAEEFDALTRWVAERGYKRVDINLGCPFPLITGKKKGAGMLPYPERVKEVLSPVKDFPEMHFSVKMRLGMENAGEGGVVLSVLNDLRLEHVSIHARIGKQQYKGVPDLAAFERFYLSCSHPLFYNGDLKTVEDIRNIFLKFPLLRGVVIGRGLLASPLLAKEFKENVIFREEERKKQYSGFHEALFEDYRFHLQGGHQLLTKMKTVWEYLYPEAGVKGLKKIRKANRIEEYREVVKQIFQE